MPKVKQAFAIPLTGLAVAALAAGCRSSAEEATPPCTSSALTQAEVLRQPLAGWTARWYACGDGWAVAAGKSSSVGFGIAALRASTHGWREAPLEDGAYFADAPGHLCAGEPRPSGLPPYRLLITLVRRADLIIDGCSVSPPSTKVGRQ